MGLGKRDPLWGIKNDGRKRHLFLPPPLFSVVLLENPSFTPVSINLHCHPPKATGLFHRFIMNALRTWGTPCGSARGPWLSIYCWRAAIITRVPNGISGRKEEEQDMQGKISVLGWDGVGVVGRSCHEYILNFVHWNSTYFFLKIKLQMAITVHCKVSYLYFTLNKFLCCSTRVLWFYQRTFQVKSYS